VDKEYKEKKVEVLSKQKLKEDEVGLKEKGLNKFKLNGD